MGSLRNSLRSDRKSSYAVQFALLSGLVPRQRLIVFLVHTSKMSQERVLVVLQACFPVTLRYLAGVCATVSASLARAHVPSLPVVRAASEQGQASVTTFL